ncbi:MAG: dihydrolipoamide acetyltransferase family protein [Chloroflexota bacterium]|nr:dihydrolipoamide acetyltransferase family protein [Chloroflexota bacterium]
MAKKVIMPKLGMAMSEGKVVEWFEDDGTEVEEGETIVVVASSKIVYDVEAPADGILRHIAQVEETLPVGGLVGFILNPGEELPEIEKVAPLPPEEAPAIEKAKTEVEEKPEFVHASPLARRIAKEEGLELTEIEGSGPGGRIVKEDVQRALEGRKPSAPPKSISFTGMRESIAEQMVHSLCTMAQLTMTTKVDVTELRAARAALRERWDKKISYTDLLVKAATLALADHSLLGARLEGDEILMPTALNIGVAVALEDGLIVPVIRNTNRLTVPEISDTIKDLARRARSDELRLDEVSGAVFTITNLGMLGVDVFTPIINPPEVAILGVGRIVEEVVWVNGQAAPRAVTTLSLTIDHRVVDGAPGAAFLQTLTQLLEHPALIFAGSKQQEKK